MYKNSDPTEYNLRIKSLTKKYLSEMSVTVANKSIQSHKVYTLLQSIIVHENSIGTFNFHITRSLQTVNTCGLEVIYDL